jgi:hypothetical protein
MTHQEYFIQEYNLCVVHMSNSARLATERTKHFPKLAFFYQEQAAKWSTRMFTCKLLYDNVEKANNYE